MEPRISFWKDSLRYVRDYPVAGTGLGTFGLGFRHYQTTTLEKYVDHAHNDYLEVAAETGVAGAALFFLPILWLLAKMITTFLDDTGRYREAVTLGCIGSTVALLLHSLTDFNLQILANALVFAVVLGIAYKIVFIERQEPLPAAPA
jgi:O-antigen ligase